MMDTRFIDTNLTLIVEVRKHPCLYNSSLSDYSVKDETDKAWREIATALNLKVHETKEKWRNIRSAFTRSLKGSKIKRPYYLCKHLKFLIPYIKSNSVLNLALVPSSPPVDNDWSWESDDNNEEETFELAEPKIADVKPTRGPQRPSKRPQEEAHSSFKEAKFKMTNSQPRNESGSYGNSNNTMQPDKSYPSAMQYFLLSLLPEFEAMTEGEKRHFKIEVLLLIDKILKDRRRPDANAGSSDNNEVNSPSTPVDPLSITSPEPKRQS